MSSLTEAEELRRNRRHADALPVFQQAWEARRHPDVGWRLANCLRNVGRPADALAICEEVLEQDPDNLQAKREAVWAIHAASFKPALEREDYPAALAAARRMEALEADGVALKRIVLSLARLAKTKGDWQAVVDWTAKLPPEELDPNPRTWQGRTFLPERLLWYFARVRALLELGLFAELLDLVEQAEKTFPGQKDLLRWKAMALDRLGRTEEALDLLRRLSSRERDAYIHDTLAEVAERAGKEDLAWAATCRAMAAPGKLPVKIRTIERLARLALARGDGRTAALHARLALDIREREGWKISFELEDLAGRAEAALEEPLPALPRERLLEECRRTWKVAPEIPDGESDGVVTVIPEGKPFAFIRLEDGRDVFTPLEVLPEELRRRGARVHVRWKIGWDRKKNRDSLQAIGILPLTRPATGDPPGRQEEEDTRPGSP